MLSHGRLACTPRKYHAAHPDQCFVCRRAFAQGITCTHQETGARICSAFDHSDLLSIGFNLEAPCRLHAGLERRPSDCDAIAYVPESFIDPTLHSLQTTKETMTCRMMPSGGWRSCAALAEIFFP